MFNCSRAYNRNIDKRRARYMVYVRETIPCIAANFYMQLHSCCIKGLTVQLEYFDRLVVSTHLIKSGRIWVTSGSDLHYYLGQWVIRVTDGDPVATLVMWPQAVKHYQSK